MDLGSQFIYWWVSSQSYKLCFKHSLDSPTIKCPYGFQLNTLFHLLLAFFALFFLSSPRVYSLSYFFSSYLSLFPQKNQPPICLPLLYYIPHPPLAGFKSLLFIGPHAIALSPIIPRKIMSSEDSFETYSKHRIVFGIEFPKGTNCARLLT